MDKYEKTRPIGLNGEKKFIAHLINNGESPQNIKHVLLDKNHSQEHPYILSQELGEKAGIDIAVVSKKPNYIEIVRAYDVKHRTNPKYQDCYLELYGTKGSFTLGYNNSDFISFVLCDGTIKSIPVLQILILINSGIFDDYLIPPKDISRTNKGQDIAIPFDILETHLSSIGTSWAEILDYQSNLQNRPYNMIDVYLQEHTCKGFMYEPVILKQEKIFCIGR
jgi:hypothetical protein